MKNSAKLMLAALFIAALSILAMQPARAENRISGKVWQVDVSNVYMTLDDHTAIRIPVETARFTRQGAAVDFRDLAVGDRIEAFYTPVYGFQNHYLSSSSLTQPPPVAAATYLWYDGVWHYTATMPQTKASVIYFWSDGRWNRR